MADTLDLGDGGGEDTVNGIVNFDGSTTAVLTASITGLLISPFLAVIDIINAATNFVTAPLEGAGGSITALFSGLIEAPAGLIEAGVGISENALRSFLGESLAGALALPITTALVLSSLYLVAVYLDEEETGNLIPGLPTDIPFIGTDEEATDDQ